jgi:peptidoglycan/LPS O-acetylase OafA/YrhL
MGMGGETESRGHSRVGALDGLRGLAVAAVLLYHSQYSFARGGFLGVSAFFTLSGFLITSLLLTQQERKVPLRRFWGRRARRLLPAAMLALVGVLIFAATVATNDQLRLLRGDVIATLTYVANWRFYASGQSYAHLFSAPSPVLHFWSLAIEEQFYLVFPLIIAVVMWATRRTSALRRRQVLGGLLTAGILASVIASRMLYPRDGSARVYYGTDTRAAELLVGALLAVILAGRITMDRPASARVRGLAAVGGFGALGVMVWWWATVEQSTAWLYHGGFALHACLAAIVIAAARVQGPFARGLAWRPLAALGLISYGVYLYHWPIYLWLTPARTGLPAVPLLALRVSLTLSIAIFSFLFLEQPILRGERSLLIPRRISWPRLLPAPLAIPLVATAIVTTLILVTTSVPPSPIVFAPLSSISSVLQTSAIEPPKPPPVPTKKPMYRRFTEHRPLRVLVVGDSVGQTLGRGLELWAAETGRATVENDAMQLCSLGRVLPRVLPLGEVEAPASHCTDWPDAWKKTIGTFNPDVVIVQYSVWEAEGRKLPDGRIERPGKPALDRWQLGEYQAAADVLSARGAPVLWLNIACEGAAIQMHEPFWVVDYQTIPDLAASRPAVQAVDMNHLMCPGGPPNPTFHGVENVRPDNAHFSDAGALAVAQWLMPIVLGQKPAPREIFEKSR